ncbi:hypothetical protein U4960_02310 [Altererythrobacter sp. H2]|uniref:hypothetical protein n=1 Tax=Altererythrobacter sp. H2 TaxID=3108391 RepID=UPI000BD0B072|nr:hypothetical protein [Altererythrobacter sp. H2]OZA94392.1 MAG: hypothetical protein B7X57_01735 [Erythrobacter sp. 34-65-8]WRK96187.1 hypothetical protein U4960_02310 [Altererythrobacter sp. H2]
MLHKFFEKGYWFETKKLGYGAGLPIAWQGWVLLLSHLVLMIGLGLLMTRGDVTSFVLGVAGMVASTVGVVMIAKARTRGEWKWRG